MSTDQDTDRQPSQQEEWEAVSHYTTHSLHHRKEREAASHQHTSHSSSRQEQHRDIAFNQHANQPPPPPQQRRQPQDQYAYQPPFEGVERENFLSRVKRRTAFWIITILGALVIFVLIAMVYGTAGEMGLINTDLWMANFGMVCGMFASWWLYGQVVKKKFGYPSIFA